MTAGPERFRSVGNIYYRGAHGVFLVGAVTDPDSMNHLPDWKADFMKWTAGPRADDFPISILMNKTDKPRLIDKSHQDEFMLKNNLDCQDVSALDGSGINEAFESLVMKIILYQKLETLDSFLLRETVADSDVQEGNWWPCRLQ